MPKSRNRLAKAPKPLRDLISRPSPKIENMGARIRQLRESRGLTCEQFGEKVGVSKAAVSFWENGQTVDLKLKTFERVLEVLQTDFEYLVHGVKRRRGKGLHHKA